MKHGEQHDSNWLPYDPEDTLMLKPAKKIWDQGKVQERMRSRRNQMFWQAEAVRRPGPGHHSIKSPLPNKPEDWEGWASDEERELVNCRRWFLTPYTGQRRCVGEIDAFLSTKRQHTSTPSSCESLKNRSRSSKRTRRHDWLLKQHRTKENGLSMSSKLKVSGKQQTRTPLANLHVDI